MLLPLRTPRGRLAQRVPGLQTRQRALGERLSVRVVLGPRQRREALLPRLHGGDGAQPGDEPVQFPAPVRTAPVRQRVPLAQQREALLRGDGVTGRQQTADPLVVLLGERQRLQLVPQPPYVRVDAVPQVLLQPP